jgi:glycosyltransferase involved in cell wall biosynthesis
MKFKLIIGIPSYNEEKTISNVVRSIDDGLSLLNEEFDIEIVNCDNDSTDGTVKQFLGTTTSHSKISMSSHNRGKGFNMRKILEHAEFTGVDGVIFFDSDLNYVPKEWLFELADGLKKKYDAVFTRRIPRWNGGDLTYHLTYPLIRSFWNADMHEPISGDFGFSRKFIKIALSKEWDEYVLGYGVDFFFATIAAQLRWSEIMLEGKKDHKLRSYKTNDFGYVTMNPKFKEVMLTAKKLMILNTLGHFQTESTTHNEILKKQPKWKILPVPTLDADIDQLKSSVLRKFNSEKEKFIQEYADCRKYFQSTPFIGISNLVWMQYLLRFIFSDFDKEKITLQIDLFENLFFMRVIGFFHDIQGNDDWYDEVEHNATKLKEIYDITFLK